ncbi:hypothetical protein TWF102_011351 [Orbilia oligospora]|uniref:Heterokaryon incompatibility domain-containing protein n=1 Tax=Orbilia oligospora TaxID=2813651 RepID=A0A7C8NMT8_ORBOL|nr:hypothetical protein TWF102_011351 [Orbilia oligospora]KAF3092199.1 hypothetical protein TWF103_011332 [Orbilia oligospora]KAF3092201.1 hypothetical protein TWF103_011332 [Orbilia oligospora]KAF3120864.1 hypothetical protein TWF703_002302 [Orbilia oligospora]
MPYEIDSKTGLIHQVEIESSHNNDIYSRFVHPNNDVDSTLQGRDSFSRKLMSLIYNDFQKDDQEIPDRKVLSPAAVDLNESLLLSPQEGNNTNSTESGCSNLVEREYTWLRRVFLDIQAEIDQNWPMLNHIASICKASRIYRCQSPICQEHHKQLDDILPPCDWPAFREWIIEVCSCQIQAPYAERLTRPYVHLSCAVLAMNWFLEGLKLVRYTNVTAKYINLSGEKIPINLYPICEIIYWGVGFQIHSGNRMFGHLEWGNTMIPHSVVAPALVASTNKARERGICLNRLWNVSLISDRGEHDLPAIMSLAARYPKLRHKNHESCTAGFCGFNTVDATYIRQLHVCEGDGVTHCRGNRLFFDPELLKISMANDGGTAWSIDEPLEVLGRQAEYATISHVWSDGTGVGIEPPGYINRCLFEHFAKLVRLTGCNAIWWDSISIPSDPVLRKEAINNMHNNYFNSKCTIVHDKYLADFDWAEDGSPALALIFSPWFTRGWTAVECNMARRIKVVYKKPGSNEPIIKDLDNDILAKDPTRCSRAHWIASNIIRRLRAPIESVSNLLAILKPRSTSQPRDKMMIAGLLAGIEVSYSMAPANITKAIFEKIKHIAHSSLLHQETSISESGGWSWCPNHLYDLPASPPGEFRRFMMTGRSCIIDKNGTILGEFPARRVNRDDFLHRRVVPTSSHPFVSSQIKAGLENWQNCLLIGHYPGPYILVETELPNDGFYSRPNYLPSTSEALCCRYLGTVNAVGDEDMYSNQVYDALVYHPIIIGREPDMTFGFKTFLKFPTQQELVYMPGMKVAPALKWAFSFNHVWMGDNPIYGDLLVLQRAKVPHPTFGPQVMVWSYSVHNLEVKETSTEIFEISIKEDPCFTLTPGRYIDKVSKWWSEQTPNFSYVDIAQYWPTLGIRSNERAMRPDFTRDVRSQGDAVPSENLFRLDFLSRTITYAAIDNSLTDPSNPQSLSGVWACIYPDGKYEFHLFDQSKKDDLRVTKITSITRNIPRGYRVLDSASDLLPVSPDLKLGRVRQMFRTHPKHSVNVVDDTWIYVGIMVRDLDTIDLCEVRGLRNVAGPEYFWKYRRVPKALLFGGRPLYMNTPVEAVEPPVPSWPWRSINWLGFLLRNLLRN